MVQHATVDEVVLCVLPESSSGGTTGLYNPLLGKGLIDIFPRIGPCFESSDIINNRGGVFCWGLCRVLMREVNAEASSVQGSYKSVVSSRNE
jgi:hypothetical protein